MTNAYCIACGWTKTVDELGSRDALNRAMIDHYGETGHGPIVTTDATSDAIEIERERRGFGGDGDGGERTAHVDRERRETAEE